MVVINHKTTKFESNSQQACACNCSMVSCYQSQNYKIWKQFTTCRLRLTEVRMLLSITKLRNLKAIHNGECSFNVFPDVVINRKTTKFESNSQPLPRPLLCLRRCYQSQNYKIWKQFTTNVFGGSVFGLLLSITKLQNLKAIHNVLKPDPWPLNPKSCYQSQNYKIWKQFTT